MMPTRAALGLALSLLGGCGGKASAPGVGELNPASASPGVIDLAAPGTPVPAERFLQPDYARLAPGDQFYVKALSYDELNGTVTVAPDGRINLSLVGSVMAGGKTLQELDDELSRDYAAYFRNFDLALLLVANAPRQVYVFGQVHASGRFPFYPGDRVVHSLALAGGLLDTAKENGVILLRRDLDGTDHVYRLDFSHLVDKLAPQDIFLQPGDVVFVPKSVFRTFTDFANEFLDVVQRSLTSALVARDLQHRVTTLSVGR